MILITYIKVVFKKWKEIKLKVDEIVQRSPEYIVDTELKRYKKKSTNKNISDEDRHLFI